MELEKTDRGFAFGEFTDAKGVGCSIQDSSLATEAAIWFGVRDADPKRLVGDVFEKVPFPENIQPKDIFGGIIDVGGSFGKDVLFNTRMHLVTKHVKTLIRNFEKFLTTRKCRTREFEDRYGAKCSIRVTKDCLELGCDDADPKICDRGWRPVPYPEGTIFTTHMFLGVDEIVQLLPILKRFVESGYILE